MIDLTGIQRAIATYYGTVLADTAGVQQVLPIMPTVPTAGSVYVWQAEQWIEPAEDDGTFCSTLQASYSLEVLASMSDAIYSQEWLSSVVSQILSAPECPVGDTWCRPVSAPRLRLLQVPNNNTLHLGASINLSSIPLEAN